MLSSRTLVWRQYSLERIVCRVRKKLWEPLRCTFFLYHDLKCQWEVTLLPAIDTKKLLELAPRATRRSRTIRYFLTSFAGLPFLFLVQSVSLFRIWPLYVKEFDLFTWKNLSSLSGIILSFRPDKGKKQECGQKKVRQKWNDCHCCKQIIQAV